MDIYWLAYFCLFITLLSSCVNGGRKDVRNWDEFDHEKNNVEVSNELVSNDEGSKFSLNVYSLIILFIET